MGGPGVIRLGVPALLVAWTALAPPPSAEGPAPVLPRNVLAHEEFLASDALHGRGSGTRDEWIAATYIGSQLRQFGVEPAGDEDARGEPGYVQVVPPGGGRKAATYNALGVLRGSDAKAADEVILLSAHLDHLGKSGANLYPGTDDNGSGSALLVALMRKLAAENLAAPFDRSIGFLWTSGEERGLLGAAYYVDNPAPAIPLAKIRQLVNMDMVGRWDDTRFSVGADTTPACERRSLVRVSFTVHHPLADPRTCARISSAAWASSSRIASRMASRPASSSGASAKVTTVVLSS